MMLVLLHSALFFPFIYSDCLGPQGIRYPEGEIVSIGTSLCNLCVCHTDSQWKCRLFDSCDGLICPAPNPYITGCCIELKCESIIELTLAPVHRIARGVMIFIIVFVIVVVIVIILLIVLCCYCCRRRNKTVVNYVSAPDGNFGAVHTGIQKYYIGQNPVNTGARPNLYPPSQDADPSAYSVQV
ncbi:hypothetical protein RF11_05635 [Thelohanellus kitauei]|uniref:Uncharacterized protein n=1 Tax=Thelohanellus kitauei TaxID=669202 RepID=A0A0C2M649_THEKT|nr:hypothetical protein RF11_05635 [Thelohanellus kitauei]